MKQVYFLIALLALAAAFGYWRRRTDGRTKTQGSRLVLGPAELGVPLGERATLLQFSSAFCSPCRATRQLLSQSVPSIPGVVHVELDAEANLELVRRLNIMRTPTTLLLDAQGAVRNRVTGVPNLAELLAAIAAV